MLQKRNILNTLREKTFREITEAFHILKRGSQSSISTPFLTFQSDEIQTLKPFERAHAEQPLALRPMKGQYCVRRPITEHSIVTFHRPLSRKNGNYSRQLEIRETPSSWRIRATWPNQEMPCNISSMRA